MSRVLVVEDERILAKNLGEKLTAHGHDVNIAYTCRDALSMNEDFLPDVIVLDLRLPDGDGLALLPQFRTVSPSTNVIVVTAHGNERIAVDAMKAGAYEYLTKPIDLEELKIVVERAVDHRQMAESMSFLRDRQQEHSSLDRIVGQSEAVASLKETIQRLTRSEALRLCDPPLVLITGETGTGKDLVAQAIHYHGPRSKKPFIHVNCTAIPAALFESELFGHMRGAFTNAAQAKRGLFEVAEGGTIFLDEIGHLSPEMQMKLLHAIEHRGIRPVGSTEARSINVHIIAATNRDLQDAIDKGEFREDLYHRLHVVLIHLPPLRERPGDIPLLAEHFLALHCRRFGSAPRSFSEDAMKAMCRYSWRGNIRELNHAIESAVLQSTGSVIQAKDLPLIGGEPEPQIRVSMVGGRHIDLDFENGCPSLEEVEQTILQAAYDHTGQNLSRAARILGITREALRYRLKLSRNPENVA
ncbi:MAG TPA: sigma-54 dependent transcriptional regulator [Phycisphaerae bacterium]|nr:sigma-54 dependent transcriptional regulator [Phycisphaerae bacterium]